jgi:fibronectin-binding autotransporter adhesin
MEITTNPGPNNRAARLGKRRAAFILTLAALLRMGSDGFAANKYFDVSTSAGLGGTGTFGTTFSTSASGNTALTTAASGDALIFGGTAGTVTLTGNAPSTGAFASATFNTTNYFLKTNDGTTRVFNTGIALAPSVNLNLLDSAATADRILSIGGSIAGGTGSSLTIKGAQTGVAAARINMSVANSTISVPIIINQTGVGFAGIVATATGQFITGTITNNSMGATLLGAADGNDLTVNGKISGTADLRIAAGSGSSGIGGGVVTLNAANNYTGATIINNSSAGVLRLGVNNALSTTSALTLGGGTGSTGALDMNGKDQTVASLSTNVTGSANGITNTSSTSQSTLTINGSANTTYASTIGIAATTTNLAGSNNNIAVTLASTNTGPQILSGNNTYTGATTINGGTLSAANGGNNAQGGTGFQALGGTASILVTTGGTLLLEANNQMSNAATMSLAGGTLDLNGNSEGVAGVTGVGTLTLTATSTLDFGADGEGNSLIQFAAIGGAINLNDNIVLQINNWQGMPGTGGGVERLLFGGSASEFTSRFAQNEVTFDGVAGYTAVQFGSYYEVTTPLAFAEVPEPGTVFGGLALLGMVGYRERRRAEAWFARSRKDAQI